MNNSRFMTADEVAAELQVSKSTAYKIIRELNAELEEQGYRTVQAKVSRTYFEKRFCYKEVS